MQIIVISIFTIIIFLVIAYTTNTPVPVLRARMQPTLLFCTVGLENSCTDGMGAKFYRQG